MKASSLMVSACMLCATSLSANLVIDDFNTDLQSWNISFPADGDASPDVTLSADDTGGAEIIGGSRTLIVDVQGAPGFGATSGEIGNLNNSSLGDGLLFASASPTTMAPGTAASLIYSGDSGDGFDPVDMSSLYGIELEFLTVNDGSTVAGLDIGIELISSNAGSAIADAVVAKSAGNISLVVPFGDFATGGGFDLSSVTEVGIYFNEPGVQNVDFVLSRVTAVPEPGTYAMLGTFAACITMAKRRAKKGRLHP